ncbi:hypothetical protein [Ectopseudomonas alcaliphila]|uniref:Uncharacterized protein n=1 Tax=Ectopseudomonas alcaliphila TaxID=101564 RepID=A0A1G6UHQ1_9GAMM|nr:hypothetical protein [Pseudomonas alcaliphila]MDX5991534.1 hypothetical protein [Pseudomonas alcaliphila]SDD40065.1 hypothetical protein SAMN05216575_101486 [Pseudomonas alcaliphila]
MITLKYIVAGLVLSLAAPAYASDVYRLTNGISIHAPTNIAWKKLEQTESELSLTRQTDKPPYYTSFLTFKISTVDSSINRIENIIDDAGKRLSRFSLNESNRERLISLSYKRENFLNMDCISSKWETLYPRENEDNTIYRMVQMIECPDPKSSNNIVSLSFAHSGKESSIPTEMQEDAEKFFKSLTFSSVPKK